MLILSVQKNRLAVRQREPTTSGSVNANSVLFQFSSDWDGLTRTAVFKAGGVSRSILLDESGECLIPWEVLEKPGVFLLVGVYGERGGEIVLPTVWASLGTILKGAAPGEGGRPPTPELWEQGLARKGDRLSYDGLELSLMSGDKPLSTVQIPGGGGEGGVPDHRLLTGREAADQHPITAITGLERELTKRVAEDDALSIVDIIKIMEG